MPRSDLARVDSGLRAWYEFCSAYDVAKLYAHRFEDGDLVVKGFERLLRQERLDNLSAIFTTPTARCLVERVREWKKEMRPGRRRPDRLADGVVDLLSDHRDKERVRKVVNRIIWQYTDDFYKDWFPVFVTLTVRPEEYENAFHKKSKYWRSYINDVETSIRAALGWSRREAAEKEYHYYVGIAERGSKTGRLHFHVLHWCKALPGGAQDPNRGMVNGVRREIIQWRQFWRHGYVSAVAVRLNANDVYARSDWRWPMVRQEDGSLSPYEAKGAKAVGYYMGKYLLKTENRKDYWRCRIKQKTGLMWLRRMMGNLTLKRLWRIATSHLPPMIRDGVIVPESLVRIECLRELMKRQKGSLRLRHMSLEVAPTVMQRTKRIGPMPTLTSRSTGDFRWLVQMVAQTDRQSPVSGLNSQRL